MTDTRHIDAVIRRVEKNAPGEFVAVLEVDRANASALGSLIGQRITAVIEVNR